MKQQLATHGVGADVKVMVQHSEGVNPFLVVDHIGDTISGLCTKTEVIHTARITTGDRFTSSSVFTAFCAQLNGPFSLTGR